MSVSGLVEGNLSSDLEAAAWGLDLATRVRFAIRANIPHLGLSVPAYTQSTPSFFSSSISVTTPFEAANIAIPRHSLANVLFASIVNLLMLFARKEKAQARSLPD